MALLSDPHAWLSFITLTGLEIVLGIDNIIFLTVLVERVPEARRGSARLLGLGFAMLTRIALLFSVVWLASLRAPLFAVLGHAVAGRDIVLFAGGGFLAIKSAEEIRDMSRGDAGRQRSGKLSGFWAIIVQIGLIDILFSLDTVFTAVGLANRLEVMVAAIVASVVAMMAVSSAVGAFIGRHPSLKVLALAFLVLIGGELIAESLGWDIPQGYLYFAMAFSAVVEWINIRLRGRSRAAGVKKP
jgi:predicted tellurium resistance membrane protein TerC